MLMRGKPMSKLNARASLFLAGLLLFTSATAQETYHERYTRALDRRANEAMAQFQSNLSKSRSTGDQSTSRILLSFRDLVPADDVISKMAGLGIEIEDLQISVGETVNSISIAHRDPFRAEPAVNAELNQLIAQQERGTKWLLATETLEEARHWLLENQISVKKFKLRMAESNGLLISGIGCVASNDEIDQLMTAMPSVIRAVEYQGTLRIMSIPVETYRGWNE